MPTYAIGDIQGCTEQLQALLEHIRFDPLSDKLWLAGDLINRGPDSLGTLRLLYSIKDSVTVVLGNHDLHLLAVQADKKNGNNKDNFHAIFTADDQHQLLDWLRFCPLIHREGDYLLVHAGIYPFWDEETAFSLAAEVEQVLRGSEHTAFFNQMYGNQPEKWSTDLKGHNRLRFITNVFTRMRYCSGKDSLDLIFKGPLEEAPDGLTPWFNVTNRIPIKGTILHGHWASLADVEHTPGIINLDTGCVWGNTLSAWCLEEKHWYSVPGYQK